MGHGREAEHDGGGVVVDGYAGLGAGDLGEEPADVLVPGAAGASGEVKLEVAVAGPSGDSGFDGIAAQGGTAQVRVDYDACGVDNGAGPAPQPLGGAHTDGVNDGVQRWSLDSVAHGLPDRGQLGAD